MMMNLLAETGGGGEGLYVSVAAIAALGVAITAVIKAFKAGVQKGKEAMDSNVTLKKPVPTINTREEPEFVTMEIFNGHLRRIESSFEEIKETLDSERGIARTANGNIHKRIDALSEKMGERLGNLEGTLAGVAQTTRTLLDLALGKNPNPSNSSTKR